MTFAFYLWGICLLIPLMADDLSQTKLATRIFEDIKKGKYQIKLTNGFLFASANIIQDMDSNKYFLPIIVTNNAGLNSTIRNVFLFNNLGEGVELQEVAGYGVQSSNQSVRIDIWSSDLLAEGDYTPYLYWSNGKTGGIERLPTQTLLPPDTTRLFTAIRNNRFPDGVCLSFVRSYGNLRVAEASEVIADLLTNQIDRQTRDACLVAIAKTGLSDTTLMELINKRQIKNASSLLEQIRELEFVFRENAQIADLLKVNSIENNEAKISVLLRLAYIGKKDLINKVPVEMSWNQLIKFKLALIALADKSTPEISVKGQVPTIDK